MDERPVGHAWPGSAIEYVHRIDVSSSSRRVEGVINARLQSREQCNVKKLVRAYIASGDASAVTHVDFVVDVPPPPVPHEIPLRRVQIVPLPSTPRGTDVELRPADAELDAFIHRVDDLEDGRGVDEFKVTRPRGPARDVFAMDLQTDRSGAEGGLEGVEEAFRLDPAFDRFGQAGDVDARRTVLLRCTSVGAAGAEVPAQKVCAVNLCDVLVVLGRVEELDEAGAA